MNAETVTLRPITDADQEQILDILTSTIVSKTYMLPDFESRTDAIPLFDRLMDLSYCSERYVRCVTLDNTAVGFINDVEIKNGTIELGYVIHPAYHNRELMTQALTLAFQELWKLGFDTVLCGAFEENMASIRVMEKCGMHQIPRKDKIEYRGATHTCVYYSKRNR